jgi:hypothetical protein
MQAHEWARIENIFHEAVTLDLPERSKFLNEICRDAPELRLEVEELLGGPIRRWD